MIGCEITGIDGSHCFIYDPQLLKGRNIFVGLQFGFDLVRDGD